MQYQADLAKCVMRQAEGHRGGAMLSEENGCTNGCQMGGSVYTATEYPTPAVHDYQEGFLVVEGTGRAQIGESEFALYPGVAFIVPAGVSHTMKKDADVQDGVRLFWFHAAQ
jgi:mannose-6-phosphate isomerase-like protein (cupin superfamily)